MFLKANTKHIILLIIEGMLLGVDPDFAESESCIISEVSVCF